MNPLQVQHEYSARVEDLFCHLTSVLRVAEFFPFRYTLVGNQLEMKPDGNPKETCCVFSKCFFNTNHLGNCDTSPKG